MGLKWIGNYVQEGKEGRPHVKENSHLIIDGDSMVYMVPETRLATREDGMRGLIKREFQMWKELAGDIVVFFDGSSGECKIATSLKRRSKRRGNFSVPLLKVTMKSVLKELSIPVKQCWGEADNVMLSYAQAKSPEYNEIYVLTRDSDFFCANVSILSRTKLDSELSQVVTYEREGILNALNLEPRHLPLYALLVESDYLEYENLEWVYRKMFPKIDKETYTYMCKKSYCHSFLNVIAVYIKHCERKLGEAFQVTSEAGAAVALRQIMGTDDPPKHVFKKIWEALVELLPIQRVPDDIGLPAEFTEEFLKGNLDCDFADMYLGMEWWADPLCELEDTHPPLARLPFFLQIRKYLYGLLAFPSSKPFKEYGVMGVTEAARYGLLSPATLPEQLTVKGVKYSLQTIWSRSLAPCEENRIDAVCSMLLGRILYPRPDLRNADHVVSLFVTCLYHACPEGGLLNFEIEAAINALTNHDETILDDLVKGDKERQLCSLATHVLVHIGYAVDVFRVADRVECVRTGAWPTFCFSSFYSAYQRFLPPTDRSKTNFTEASRTFSPTHAGIFSLSSSWCSVDLTSLTGSGWDMLRRDVFAMVEAGDLRSLEPAIALRPAVLQSKDRVGRSLLHVACAGQFVEIVEFLISNGADVKAVDEDKHTAVHYSVGPRSDTEASLLLVRILSNAGADIFRPGKNGETLLHRAARYGHCRLASFLVKELRQRHTQPSLAMLSGADGSRTSRGESRATRSISDRSSSDPTRATRSAESIKMAGRRRHRRRGKFIIPEFTVNQFLNLRSDRGETALHLAAGNSHLGVVEILLSFEADSSIKDYRGRTPYNLSAHWTIGPSTKELRSNLKPVPVDESVPLLVFTPAAPLTPPPQELLPLSPRREVSPVKTPRTPAPLSYKSERDGSALTPCIDLMLEFARDELRELRDKKSARESMLKRSEAKVVVQEQEEEEEDDDEGEVHDEEEDLTANDGELAPYHKVLHMIDCQMLELRTALDSTQEKLDSASNELESMGCAIPKSLVTTTEAHSPLDARLLRRIRKRTVNLESIETAAANRNDDDRAALSSLFLLVIFLGIVYSMRSIWGAYETWCVAPTSI